MCIGVCYFVAGLIWCFDFVVVWCVGSLADLGLVVVAVALIGLVQFLFACLLFCVLCRCLW